VGIVGMVVPLGGRRGQLGDPAVATAIQIIIIITITLIIFSTRFFAETV
jgi:hypothetical protein